VSPLLRATAVTLLYVTFFFTMLSFTPFFSFTLFTLLSVTLGHIHLGT
jgi:hypothetical protein